MAFVVISVSAVFSSVCSVVTSDDMEVIEPSDVVTRVVRFDNPVALADTPVAASFTVV